MRLRIYRTSSTSLTSGSIDLETNETLMPRPEASAPGSSPPQRRAIRLLLPIIAMSHDKPCVSYTVLSEKLHETFCRNMCWGYRRRSGYTLHRSDVARR